MKIINQVLTMIYGGAAVYFIYMAIMHLVVFFANQGLGHTESFRLPMIYIVCSVIFGIVTFTGYSIWIGQPVYIILNVFFYVPIGALLLYVIWAILIILSSGGRWN
jgi:hypothetical protein